MSELVNKIQRRLRKLRLRPIRVYCLHHVCAVYDPLTMWECDWMEMEEFKTKVQAMRNDGVEFISLPEAYTKLTHDKFRKAKYAVLTFDDGYKSIFNVLPWLEEQEIPITLFVNTKYLDGKSWSAINEEQARRAKPDVDMLRDVCPNLYLSEEELRRVASMPNVTIGMHGHEHLDATWQTIEEFEANVTKCKEALRDVPHTIPYFAYTWGRHNEITDRTLYKMRLMPVLISGTKNFNNENYIDRELIQ